MKLALYWQDLLDLIYPRHCRACEERLFGKDEMLCWSCHHQLPRTDYEKYRDNPVFRRFVGRLPLVEAASWLHFEKGGRVQKLMHQFKYREEVDLAVWLGTTLGKEWAKAPICRDIDALIPVPLHRRKQRRRGYNQAEAIARGLAQSLEKPLLDNLVRLRFGRSQTKGSRFLRWRQVSQVFEVREPESLAGKHLLLVDDVVTTGATLEACGGELLKIPGLKLSLLTLAQA